MTPKLCTCRINNRNRGAGNAASPAIRCRGLACERVAAWECGLKALMVVKAVTNFGFICAVELKSRSRSGTHRRPDPPRAGWHSQYCSQYYCAARKRIASTTRPRRRAGTPAPLRNELRARKNLIQQAPPLEIGRGSAVESRVRDQWADELHARIARPIYRPDPGAADSVAASAGTAGRHACGRASIADVTIRKAINLSAVSKPRRGTIFRRGLCAVYEGWG